VLKPGAEKPANTVVLFDGKDTSQWETEWPVKDGVMTVSKSDTQTKQKFNDYQLHL